MGIGIAARFLPAHPQLGMALLRTNSGSAGRFDVVLL